MIVVSCEAICENGTEVLVVPGTSKHLDLAVPVYHYEPSRNETGLALPTRFKCDQIVPVRRENIGTITGRIDRFEYMKLQSCLMKALHLEKTDW